MKKTEARFDLDNVRDTRWEDVWAEVTPWPFCDDEGEFLRFRIEVRYNGLLHHCAHIIHRVDLVEIKTDGFKFLMDEMVRQLDAHLEKKEPYDY